MKLNPYLNFGGNCEAAFRFYEKHLGGKVNAMMTFATMPGDSPFPPEWKDKIMHASMALGETILMGSDAPPERFQPIRSSYLALETGSTPEAERIHALLAEGGEIFMPMQETFFAHRFSMLRDRFGVSWMITHNRPMPA